MGTLENNFKKKKIFKDNLREYSELGKIPPQAVDVEEKVIGSLMIEEDAYEQIKHFLTVDIFYKEEHKILYKTIKELREENLPSDLLMVTNKLKKNGNFEEVGGSYFVANLLEHVGSTANIEYHARILIEKYINREVIKLCSAGQEDAFNDTDAFDLVTDLKTNFVNLDNHYRSNDFRSFFIDRKVEVKEPPICMKIIGKGLHNNRLLTLGNFSVITGKQKSKKTFLSTLILASVVKNGIIGNKFEAYIPDGREVVLSFDTEQSYYDAYQSAKRVDKLVLRENDNFIPFDLREIDYLERCDVIENTLKHFKNTFSFVLIDGIADLVSNNNDEDEGRRVVQLLMRWTKEYNCHIMVIIHQNKHDNYATGHVGSYVSKKGEVLISVDKDERDESISKISCQNIRGVMPFDDFYIHIRDGLPYVIDDIDNTDSTIDSVNF